MFVAVSILAISYSDELYAQAPLMEETAGKKGHASFNCCKGRRGNCAIFFAEDYGGGVYVIPPLTSVVYDAAYPGPYLPGTYADALGRMRVDNVSVTFTPSDCINPETGEMLEDCIVGEDTDMNF